MASAPQKFTNRKIYKNRTAKFLPSNPIKKQGGVSDICEE